MKRSISMLLAVLLLLSCVFAASPMVHAAKQEEKRTIAIVFDNSGSMYMDANQAWCRATYAMEVFAAMLNVGDELLIYPMYPITVGTDPKEYTMDDPLRITDPSQASKIRQICSPWAGDTPIESIEKAIAGLDAIKSDNRYLIVLTDGEIFYKNGIALQNPDYSNAPTKQALAERFADAVSKGINVMYLGIGRVAANKLMDESDRYVERKASDTKDVLNYLTELCNLTFGRDTLPSSHINGKSVDFDISMKKMIVFVQGENIANVKLTGPSGLVGEEVGSATTKYSELGALNYPSYVDDKLQGMLVTYTDCPAGTYTLEHDGTATSVEIYYEPDADLDFVFTDVNGNAVDPNALYEGDYKVSFGMKDAKTGKLINSDLLGNPSYLGYYSINGKQEPIEHVGQSGEETMFLKEGDVFDAELTVTYLSGYSIKKDKSDFGWPDGGIVVKPRPAKALTLEISGGESEYSLQDLDEGAPFIAKVYCEGQQLTGDALKSVKLSWDAGASNAMIQAQCKDDHYELKLSYPNPAAPQDTQCGECTLPIHASYTEPGSKESTAKAELTYSIKDDFSPLQLDMHTRESYIVISELENSQPIIVDLTLNGAPLSPEDFANVELTVDCGGIAHTLTPNPQDSSYEIKLLATDGIEEDNYRILATANYTDHIGRQTQSEDFLNITLSHMPLWMKWLIIALIALLVFILLWIILHIRVLPKHLHTTRKLSSMVFDGEDVTSAASFDASCQKGTIKAQSKYAGRKFGISMDVTPGKESYLYKSQKRRSALVKVATVRKFGPAKIQEILIGSAKYVLDEDNGKLTPAIPNQKPFTLTNGMMVKYSGVINDAGVDKDFEVTSKLNFKKKK